MIFLSSRLTAWILSGVVGATAFGLTWAVQAVEVPIWALLFLTFMPLESIVDALRTKLPDQNQSTEQT